jgi:predicted  nucleic acid-binding Zn-ribbon protein
MPHKCVSCSRTYPNSSPELLRGCSCGSRIFIYLKSGDMSWEDAGPVLEAALREGKIAELSRTRPVSIELVPADGSGAQGAGDCPAAQYGSGRERPAENITVVDRGEYELDIASLMAGDPLVVRSQNGVYHLRIPTARKH